MTKEKLIEYYEKQLEKVKIMHNPNKYVDDLNKDKCNAYIKYAEQELESVKNGRNW